MLRSVEIVPNTLACSGIRHLVPGPTRTAPGINPRTSHRWTDRNGIPDDSAKSRALTNRGKSDELPCAPAAPLVSSTPHTVAARAPRSKLNSLLREGFSFY